jgi:GT2 family glycosyltransferase
LYSDYDSALDPDDIFKLLDVINNDSSIAAIGAVQMSEAR